MADTITAFAGLTKPENFASTDTWGTKTNGNWDICDAQFAAMVRLTGAQTIAGVKTFSDGIVASGVTINGNTLSGLTAVGKALAEAASVAAQRTLLALVPGTDVQAFDQQLADLAALSYTGNARKAVTVNPAGTAFELAAPSGGIKGRRLGAGRYLHPTTVFAHATNTVTPAADTLFLYPVEVIASLDALVIEITTAGAAGSKVRLGIYGCNADGSPGPLIEDAGEILTDGTTTGLKVAFLAATRSMTEPFFVGCLATGNAVFRAGNISSVGGWMWGVTSPSTPMTEFGFSKAQAFGALPADAGAGFSGTTTGVFIGMRTV